jgi:YidC/Oxa1 family membrane protein insertase
MNFRDLLLPFSLALLTAALVQHFFFQTPGLSVPAGVPTSGQKLQVASFEHVYKPLNRDIDFVDYQGDFESDIQTVTKTNGQTLTFTNCGGTIQSLALRAPSGAMLSTVVEPGKTVRDSRMLTVALDTATPYRYKFAGRTQEGDKETLTYIANNADGAIKKVFTVYSDTDKVDLSLEVSPLKGRKMRLRLLMPEPQPLSGPRYRASFVQGRVSKFERHSISKKLNNNCWVAPTLFGLSGRYTVHSLVGDADKFVQRAFHKFDDKGALVAILEGPEVQEPTAWNLSFYLGPKQVEPLAAVDVRLTKALNYGWLAPVSRGIFYLLKLFNGYLHDFGLAILLLTILLRLIMMPFMPGDPGKSAKRQAEFKRRMKAVERQYKDDPERLAIEQTKIAKEQFKSMGTGCLPMLLQMPVFFGLYSVLNNAIELYHMPFLWISDLSASDPYYILPVTAGLCVALQIAVSGKGKSAGGSLFGLIMAAVLTAIFVGLPAGIQLYLMMNSLFMFLQTMFRNMMRTAR